MSLAARDAGEQPAPGTPDLTVGSIPRHIIALAIPSALSNLLNYSYHFVDMLWLGRVGPGAIAVVTTWHYFFMVFVVFNQIVGLGSITLISRTYGGKQYADCRRFIGQTFSFKLVVALLVTGLGLIFQRWAWIAFGSAPGVIGQGMRYGTVMLCVLPVYFSAFTLRTSFTAIGDMRTLLRISAVSTVLNLVLDPFLIFPTVYIGPFPALGIAGPLLTLPGAGMGVAGAAWASFAAILVLFALGQYYFMSGRTFIRVGFRDFFSWDWGTVWRILRIGTPPAVGENLTSIAQVVVGRVLNIYGTAVFAAQGVVMMLVGLVFIPVGGISQAVMTLVGQNLGADKPARAERSVLSALGMTAGVLALIVLLLALWPGALIGLFVPGQDPASRETFAWGVTFLRIGLLIMLAFGVGMVFGGAFYGSGDTKPPMWIQLATTWAIQLPLILVGALWLKLENPAFIFWCIALSQLLGTVAMFIVFRAGRWKRVVV